LVAPPNQSFLADFTFGDLGWQRRSRSVRHRDPILTRGRPSISPILLTGALSSAQTEFPEPQAGGVSCFQCDSACETPPFGPSCEMPCEMRGAWRACRGRSTPATGTSRGERNHSIRGIDAGGASSLAFENAKSGKLPRAGAASCSPTTFIAVVRLWRSPPVTAAVPSARGDEENEPEGGTTTRNCRGRPCDSWRRSPPCPAHQGCSTCRAEWR
jgi:hypothetical protein